MTTKIRFLVTVLLICILVSCFSSCTIKAPENIDIESTNKNTANTDVTTTKPETDTDIIETTETEEPELYELVSDDCLFIGDSRTAGLQLYTQTDADFFAIKGSSIFSIVNATVYIEGLGDITLESLLSKKEYGRIFVMLGVNEIGNSLSTLLSSYKFLLETIKEKQPNAYIFVEANIHVTEEFTQNSPQVNNAALDKYNAELAKFADNKKIFFLDANHLFDDETGQLAGDKTMDGIHFAPKAYTPWMKWLLIRSETLIG